MATEPDSTGNDRGIDPRAIVDEFTTLPISRQRKYQLRRQLDGCCEKCGVPVELEWKITKKGFKQWRPKLCPTHREHDRIRRKNSTTGTA